MAATMMQVDDEPMTRNVQPPGRKATVAGRSRSLRWLVQRRVWYTSSMTKLLEHAVDYARALPPAMQDDVARLLLQFLGEDQPVIQLTPEEAASFAESRAQASRREFATDDQVRSVWAKHGL